MSDRLQSVSAIIVHYRTPEHLRNCLESLAPYRARGLEIVVVDNDSGEGAPVLADEQISGITLVEMERNVGYARAVNAGMKRARGAYFLILNPDVEVHPGAVDSLLDAAADHPEAGIIAPRLLNADGTLQHSCRRFYDVKTFLYRRTPLGRLRPDAAVIRRHLMLDYDHAQTRVVDWVLGGAMLVRRRAVEEVGPMDERFFLYFEDVDWCYRMHQRGWRVVYEPSATMLHVHRRESAKRPLGKSFFSHAMSVVRFYEKWSLVLYVLKSQREELGRVLRLGSDLAAVNLGFLAAWGIRMLLGEVLEKPVFGFSSYRNFWLFGNALALGTFYTLGFYRRVSLGRDWVDHVFMLGRGSGIVTIVMMATTFLLYTQSYSRAMVLLFWPLSTAFLFIGRQLIGILGSSVRDRRLDLARVAVVGEPSSVEETRRFLSGRESIGFEPIYLPGYAYRAGNDEASDPERNERFLELVRAERIARVLFVSPTADAARMVELVPRLSLAGVRVHVRPEFSPILDPDARVEELGGAFTVALGSRGAWRVAGAWKRVTDVVFALALLTLAAPPNGLYALWRTAIGRRPVTRVETRFTQPGTPVRVRMYHPRPRKGLFQVLCLDPYPRLFAVLRGTWSFVGVYPFRPEEFDALPETLRRLSIDAPPGLTGLWWFQRGRKLGLERIRALDVEYVQKWSNVYDAKTFLRAATALIRTRGRLPEASAARESSCDPVYPLPRERA